jgi:hypothetical protein
MDDGIDGAACDCIMLKPARRPSTRAVMDRKVMALRTSLDPYETKSHKPTSMESMR